MEHSDCMQRVDRGLYDLLTPDIGRVQAHRSRLWVLPGAGGRWMTEDLYLACVGTLRRICSGRQNDLVSFVVAGVDLSGVHVEPG